jgi:hypothetical protein
MKNQIAKWFTQGSWLIGLMVIGVSCNDELGMESNQKNKISAEQSAQSNAEMMMAAQEVMDITGSGMASQGINYGRAADEGEGEDEEDRLCGAIVTKSITINTTLPDSLIISGSLSIDFGDGSNCGDSTHRRSGKITTEFTINVSLKNKRTYTSTETVTLDNFTGNGKALSGKFIAKAATGGMRWLEVIDAELVYNMDDEGDDDNEADSVVTISWSGELTFTYDNAGTFTREDDTKTITGSITATTNAGSFSSTITNPVTFKMVCDYGRKIPVSGTINVTSAGVVTTLDFGDGACDKLYTSTTAGTTTELSF